MNRVKDKKEALTGKTIKDQRQKEAPMGQTIKIQDKLGLRPIPEDNHIKPYQRHQAPSKKECQARG